MATTLFTGLVGFMFNELQSSRADAKARAEREREEAVALQQELLGALNRQLVAGQQCLNGDTRSEATCLRAMEEHRRWLEAQPLLRTRLRRSFGDSTAARLDSVGPTLYAVANRASRLVDCFVSERTYGEGVVPCVLKPRPRPRSLQELADRQREPAGELPAERLRNIGEMMRRVRPADPLDTLAAQIASLSDQLSRQLP